MAFLYKLVFAQICANVQRKLSQRNFLHASDLIKLTLSHSLICLYMISATGHTCDLIRYAHH